MLNKTCEEFVEILASKEAVPGGGGASAYVASLGMALGSMVGNLTLGKKKYVDVQEDIKDLLVQSEEIIRHLNDLVAQDAKVFYPLSIAYGMPAKTEKEKEEKEKVLQAALVDATLVPLEIARTALKAIRLHGLYLEKGTRIAISDVGVGVIFCKAALQGAKLNVLINTQIMKNQTLKKEVLLELDEIEKEGLQKADELYGEVEKLLLK